MEDRSEMSRQIYDDQYTEVRYHEAQAIATSRVVLVITGALVAFYGSNAASQLGQLVVAWFIALAGVFGFFFSVEHWTRSISYTVARLYGRNLEKLMDIEHWPIGDEVQMMAQGFCREDLDLLLRSKKPPGSEDTRDEERWQTQKWWRYFSIHPYWWVSRYSRYKWWALVYALIVILGLFLLVPPVTGHLIDKPHPLINQNIPENTDERGKGPVAQGINDLHHHDGLQPSAPGLGGRLVGLFAEGASAAIRTAESQVSDVKKLPTVAAQEFTRGLSGEFGKRLVDTFNDLIVSGFKPSPNKPKDAENLTILLVRDILKDPKMMEKAGVEPRLRVMIEGRAFFDNNKALLTPSASDLIAQVRSYASANPDSIVLLSSNTDRTGSSRRNRELARRRTAAVRETLVSIGGIAPNRVFSTDLADESLPVFTAPNAVEPRNRSVKIEVRQ